MHSRAGVVLSMRAMSPFFNFCDSLVLRPLDEKSITEIVTKPMRQLGIDIPGEEEFIQRFISLISSHPNLAQWMCDRLIKTSVANQITVDALEQLASTPEFQEHYVSTAWGDATALEKLISLLLDGPVFVAPDVVAKLEVANVRVDIFEIEQSL